jgi:hypothetical protein
MYVYIYIYIGAQLISEDLGLKLDKVEPSMLGKVKKVSVSKDDTVLLDGAGSKEAIADRCEQIRTAIENTTSDYEKEKLQERLAKLAGGVAVIKVCTVCLLSTLSLCLSLSDRERAQRAREQGRKSMLCVCVCVCVCVCTSRRACGWNEARESEHAGKS